jgi:hypothetical protein
MGDNTTAVISKGVPPVRLACSFRSPGRLSRFDLRQPRGLAGVSRRESYGSWNPQVGGIVRWASERGTKFPGGTALLAPLSTPDYGSSVGNLLMTTCDWSRR